MPVDQYVGGIEHAILHLLYSRFYIKFLYDIKAVTFDEPFKKLFCIGMVCRKSEKTGKVEKMSKSKGNVVSPDDIIKKYGADSLRLYELFIGPPELESEWSDSGVIGIYRFLKRSWDLLGNIRDTLILVPEESLAVKKIRNRLIHDITDRIEKFKFNTAVSAFMEFINTLAKQEEGISTGTIRDFLILITPFAPHFACALWQRFNFEDSVLQKEWPKYDPQYLIEDVVEIGVQIRGKFRGSIRLPKDTGQEDALNAALAEEGIKKHIGGEKIRKVIYIKEKILNIII